MHRLSTIWDESTLMGGFRACCGAAMPEEVGATIPTLKSKDADQCLA